MVKEFASSGKKIYDPILGFIAFDEIEKELIDSYAFQRLHYIRQLGIAYLVYPGATHTRFEHSLGVMELSTRIYKKVCQNIRPDIFEKVPRKGSLEFVYWLRIVRLAALCHDLGHLPFSHVAEEDFFHGEGHESMTLKIIESNALENIWRKISSIPGYQDRNVKDDVIRLSVETKKLHKLRPDLQLTSWEKVLSQMINGDFFGADRMDYLLRDSRCTGVVYGLFDYQQLIEMLRILPSFEKEGELVLGIDEKGIESCESLLIARYFMHKKVYQHPSVKAYNFHLRRFMRKEMQSSSFLKNLDQYLNTTDTQVLEQLHQARENKKSSGYRDAISILERKKQFKAIMLPQEITEERLVEFRSKHKIDPDLIEWELSSKEMIEQDFSFPIAKKYLFLQRATDTSSLLSKLPSSQWNWLYIAPEFEILFLEMLGQK